jgi:hypothetical protein
LAAIEPHGSTLIIAVMEIRCPLLALSGHARRLRECLLLGVKRTFKARHETTLNSNSKIAIADFSKVLEIDLSDQVAKEGLRRLGVTP